MILESGTGNGKSAKINDDNRLEVFSVGESKAADVSRSQGRSFIIASDFISLTTTGSFNGLLYLANSSELRTFFVERLRSCSTATGTVQFYLIRNPTTGTLISDANAALQASANLNSPLSFEGDAFSASGDGKTVTDGENFSNFINRAPGHSIQEYGGLIVMPPGSSMAVVAKPDVATTICLELQGWFEPI
jgi:hypothetical protein